MVTGRRVYGLWVNLFTEYISDTSGPQDGFGTNSFSPPAAAFLAPFEEGNNCAAALHDHGSRTVGYPVGIFTNERGLTVHNKFLIDVGSFTLILLVNNLDV